MSAPASVRRAGAEDLELVISRRLRFFCEMRGWSLEELHSAPKRRPSALRVDGLRRRGRMDEPDCV